MDKMGFSDYFGLAMACAAGVLAMLLGENQWAHDHQWLVPFLWIVCCISAALSIFHTRWFRRLFVSQEAISQKAIEQETHGSRSPATAVGSLGDIAGTNVNIGGIQHVTNLPASAQTIRPRVTVMSYERVGEGGFFMSGYKEVLRLHIDGAIALDVTVDPMPVGKWIVTFAGPLNLQPGNGRIEIRSIRTVMNGNAGSSVSTLDDAWRDASNGGTVLPKMTLRLSYRGFDGKRFATTCSLERDIIIRGQVPFAVRDCRDVPCGASSAAPKEQPISPTTPILRVRGIGGGFLASPEPRPFIQTVAVDNVQTLAANTAINVAAELWYKHPTLGKRRIIPFAWYPAKIGDQPLMHKSEPADIAGGERFNIPYVYKQSHRNRVSFPSERHSSVYREFDEGLWKVLVTVSGDNCASIQCGIAFEVKRDGSLGQQRLITDYSGDLSQWLVTYGSEFGD